MPIGNQVGTYTAKATSISKTIDSRGHHEFTINLEGTVSGGWDGAVLGTLVTTTSDFQVGKYTGSFSAYLADGSVISVEGAGVLKSLGNHSWQLNGTDVMSDGNVAASEGTLKLDGMSLNGGIFEIS